MTLFTKSRKLLDAFSQAPNLSKRNSRSYAISRFPKKSSGVGRTRPQLSKHRKVLGNEGATLEPHQSPVGFINAQSTAHWQPAGSSNGLEGLLLQNNTLVIERQLEMLNVFIGFEQANKYTISSETGEPLGYIAEEERGFLGALSRQAFATHRPFKAVIMDQAGLPVLWIRRPFAWINSRMFVQRHKADSEYSLEAELSLETFGEVQQIWHPWRRRYDLFLRENLSDDFMTLKQSLDQDQSSEPTMTSDEPTYHQIGKVDAGFLAWTFRVLNEDGRVISIIDRSFRGIGREVFTDTGKYSLHFEPEEPMTTLESQFPNNVEDSTNKRRFLTAKELDLDTRALLLALAVNIDFDYFSRHSHTGGGRLFHLSSWD